MNRQGHYNYISEKLMVLIYRIKVSSKLNLLDLNIHSENFFADLCNIIFKYKLVNMNDIVQNVEAIDLIDDINKLIVQVTSTCSTPKIENTLKKQILKPYSQNVYRIQFIFIDNNTVNMPDDI